MNVLEQYAKGLEVGAAERALERQEVDRIKAAEQNRALNEMYARAMGPTGQIDANALYGMLARAGMGTAIPGMQAQRADVAFKEAQARKQLSDVEAAQFKNQRDLLVPVTDQAGFDVWRTGALKTYAGIPGIETIIPAKFSPEVKDQLLLTADQVVGRMPMSPERFAQEKELRASGRSQQVVNLPPSESERGKVLGRLGGEALVAEFNAAQAASKGLSKDYEAIRLLREGKPATGITSELETTFNRFRADVAGDKEAAAKVSDSQFLEALLGSDVFNQIAALGVGARGLDTPAEREFLREVISGTRKLDKETLIRMAELRAKYKEDAVDAYNERVRSGELDEFFRDFGRPKREFAKPERPKISDQPEVVRTPDGKVFTFPNKAAANKFRKEAGL